MKIGTARVPGMRLLSAVAAIFAATFVHAQVSYTTPGQPMAFDFNDGLPAEDAVLPWVDNETFPGWYAYRRGTLSPTATEPKGPLTELARNSGTVVEGARLYLWRQGEDSSDGSLGMYAQTESSTIYVVLRIRNNTGATLRSFTVSYRGKQWINSNSGANNNIAFSYNLTDPVGLDFSAGAGFVTLSNLAYNVPTRGTAGGPREQLNGEDAANQTIQGPLTVHNIVWEDGKDIWLRWLDVDSTGEDHGMAIDDVTFSATDQVSPDAPSPISWAWSGAVTATGARIVGKVEPKGTVAQLELKTAAADWAAAQTLNPNRTLDSTTATSNSLGATSLLHFDLTGLTPNTTYHYRMKAVDQYGEIGQFTTSPPDGTPLSFTFLVASCAKGASTSNYMVDHSVFNRMAEINARTYLQIGDIHYRDLNTTSKGAYHQAYDQVLAAPAQRALYRTVPMAHSWDDHDYLANNSGGAMTGRDTVRTAYSEVFPHYPLPLDPPGAATGPIAHAFTIGRVKFIMLDNRSERYNPASAVNAGNSGANADVTNLGDGRPGTANQLGWLYQQLDAFKAGFDTGALKLCVINFGMPYVVASGTDTWAGFQKERRAISDYIVNLMGSTDVRSIIGVAGDAHMLGYDDGRHNQYATGGVGPGFPMFQCAALSNSGSTKNTLMSGGQFPNTTGVGQFAQFDVVDTGGTTVQVQFRGRRVTAGGAMSTITSYTFTTDPSAAPPPPPPPAEGFAGYKEAHFSTEERSNPAISGPLADPDGDGLSNLIEYALGLDPRDGSSQGLPQAGVTETEWIYTYNRPANRSDLAYDVEYSADLVAWSPVPGTPQLVNTEGGIETWKVTYPLATGVNVFFRIRVTAQ